MRPQTVVAKPGWIDLCYYIALKSSSKYISASPPEPWNCTLDHTGASSTNRSAPDALTRDTTNGRPSRGRRCCRRPRASPEHLPRRGARADALRRRRHRRNHLRRPHGGVRWPSPLDARRVPPVPGASGRTFPACCTGRRRHGHHHPEALVRPTELARPRAL